jgi:hypothetical protein
MTAAALRPDAHALPLLGPDDLTPQQAEGFRLAMGCMITVTRQLADAPVVTGERLFCPDAAAMVRVLAMGLSRQIAGPPPR